MKIPHHGFKNVSDQPNIYFPSSFFAENPLEKNPISFLLT